MIDVVEVLRTELLKKYGHSLSKEITFDNKCIRQGKSDHIWIYGKEWTYRNEKYQEIVYGSWHDGDQCNIKSWDIELHKEKKFNKAYIEKNKEAKIKIDKDRKRLNKKCSDWCKVQIKKYKKCKNNDYLTYKKVKAFGNLYVDSNNILIIPTYKEKGLTGFQRIFKEENKFIKKFVKGVEIQGSIFPLKSFRDSEYVILTEGYSTGATIQENIPEHPVVICFAANNLMPAIETIRAINPDSKIIIAADNDKTGRMYAYKAQDRMLNVIIKLPEFESKSSGWTDFNDLKNFEGRDKLLNCLKFDSSDFHFVTALGYNNSNYYYVSSGNKQVVSLPFNQHNQAGLRHIVADSKYWIRKYGYVSEETGKVIVNWSDASDDLMRDCHDAGVFVSENLKGVGVWKDHGNYVINDGQSVYNKPSASNFHYSKSKKVEYRLSSVHDDDLLHILEGFKMLRLKNPHDYMLIAAWIVQAQIFATLPWRFHIWLTGGAGTGKSTILKIINSLCFNSILTSNSTAAGIKQDIEGHATPIVYDESEGVDHKIKDIIQLAREMNSKGDYRNLRGTAGGKSISYNTQCIFCFGSIQAGHLNEADKSRIFNIELESVKNQSTEEYAEIETRFRNFYKIRNEFFTKCYESIDNIISNYNVAKKLLTEKYKTDTRLADQLGMAISCFNVYFGGAILDIDTMDYFIDEFKLVDSDYVKENEAKEHTTCYDTLMNTIIDSKDHTTVSRAIHKIRSNSGADHYESLLGVYGIKYYKKDEQLFISTGNVNLGKLIKEYVNITTILKRDKDLIVDNNTRIRIPWQGQFRGIKIKLKID